MKINQNKLNVLLYLSQSQSSSFYSLQLSSSHFSFFGHSSFLITQISSSESSSHFDLHFDLLFDLLFDLHFFIWHFGLHYFGLHFFGLQL
jgi:hypothetical protein